MQYIIIKMRWYKNFKTIYYLQRTGFLMVPNTCTTNFIFTYFYWNFQKFLDFKGTPKIHKMVHIRYKTPRLHSWYPFVIMIYCLYSTAMMVGMNFRFLYTGCDHTHGPWSWVQNIKTYEKLAFVAWFIAFASIFAPNYKIHRF